MCLVYYVIKYLKYVYKCLKIITDTSTCSINNKYNSCYVSVTVNNYKIWEYLYSISMVYSTEDRLSNSLVATYNVKVVSLFGWYNRVFYLIQKQYLVYFHISYQLELLVSYSHCSLLYVQIPLLI